MVSWENNRSIPRPVHRLQPMGGFTSASPVESVVFPVLVWVAREYGGRPGFETVARGCLVVVSAPAVAG